MVPVNDYRAMRSDLGELALVRKSPRYNVNAPLLVLSIEGPIGRSDRYSFVVNSKKRVKGILCTLKKSCRGIDLLTFNLGILTLAGLT